MISIHKALASLDVPFSISPSILSKFQSTRLSRASTKAQDKYRGKSIFQSTRLSRASTRLLARYTPQNKDFNPQGSREPRLFQPREAAKVEKFQSTRLSRASTPPGIYTKNVSDISIHKALASLDQLYVSRIGGCRISIHKALASLDRSFTGPCRPHLDFNPQGSREPRLTERGVKQYVNWISIHKALASLDEALQIFHSPYEISIHKALASLDFIHLWVIGHILQFQSTRLSRASTD